MSNKELEEARELSEEDKKRYMTMRCMFSWSACRNRRNMGSGTFEKILRVIKDFVKSSPMDQTKRSLACGIFWLPQNTIAINTKHLCCLLSRCKSSINGLFRDIGYLPVPDNKEAVREFINSQSDLAVNFQDLRKWSIRRLATEKDGPVLEVNKPPWDRVSDPDSLPHFMQANGDGYGISCDDI